MRLFNRRIELIIGQLGGEGVLIDGLRMAFSISKNLTMEKNTCKVDIYNLSIETRAKTEATGVNVILKAGYEDASEVIFIGDVVRSVSTRNGPDIITSLELRDGANALDNVTISESFAAGVTVGQVLDKLTKSLNLPIKEMPKNLNEAFASGVSLLGPAKIAIQELTESIGHNFSVQDNEIQILPNGRPTNEDAVYLASDTGLTGIPEKLTAGQSVGSGNQLFTGVKITSLLNPKIKPGRKIQVKSNYIKGSFMVQKVTHAGDTHGQEWSTTAEASEL